MSEPILLRRTASSLYWAGRYLERVESLARIVSEHTALLVDLPQRVPLTWEPLLAIPGVDAEYWERYEEASEASICSFLLFDADNPASLVRAVSAARDNLRTTRQVFPRTAWRLVNELHHVVDEVARAGPTGLRRARRQELFDRAIADCQQLAGVVAGSMRRDHAYDFFHLGTQLERADMTTRVLDVRAASLMDHDREPDAATAVFDDVQWLRVLGSLLGVHSFRRADSERVDGPRVVRFLLCSTRFPRSVTFCLDRLDDGLQRLPKSTAVLDSCRDARLLLGSVAAAAWSGPRLRAFVDDAQVALAEIHAALTDTYFTPAAAVPA